MNGKHWSRSKTLIFFALLLLADCVTLGVQQLPMLKESLPANIWVWLAFIGPIAGKILRVITRTPIYFGSPPDDVADSISKESTS